MTMFSRPAHTQVRVGDAILRVPRAFRTPAGYLTVDAYLRAVGLDRHPGGVAMLIGWVQTGAVGAVGYRGGLYVQAPSYRRPPPGYLPVREFAAARRRSRSRIYQLIAEGRLSPVWRQRVKRWTHAFVPIWADVKGEALDDDNAGDNAGAVIEAIRV